MRAVIIHGIYGDGTDAVDRVGKSLRTFGWDVLDVNIPVYFACFMWSHKARRRLAKQVADAVKPDDIVVARSGGCLLHQLAGVYFGSKCEHGYWISPAVSRYIKIPDGFKRVTFFVNGKDRAILLGALLPFHRFGLGGRHGYNGQDERVENEHIDKTCSDFWNHKCWTEGGALNYLVDVINEDARIRGVTPYDKYLPPGARTVRRNSIEVGIKHN